jgi:hypothetical protein
VALSIEVGDESTWPAAFAKVALRSKQLIISYKVEADRIERLGYDDVYLRNYPPPNEFKAEYTTWSIPLKGCSRLTALLDITALASLRARRRTLGVMVCYPCPRIW